ncbi:recombinase family protein [Paraburkholderia ribeironis]|uniref:recombinase family protein n=1 Tax=Paraburkholderia ribeironis TaxID=1247936 RepID=UPI001FE362C4|nr:recombinase family protein [Paraburkholderia ribeironis]
MFRSNYVRVSTQDQDASKQLAQLRAVGCNRVFSEKVFGTRRAHPQLDQVIERLRAGDAIVVTRLDRLARSFRDLLGIVARIHDAGAGLRSLVEPWADTTTSAGGIVLTVFNGIAEFERKLIVERASTGRAAAMARGTKFGRKAVLGSAQVEHIYRLVDEGNTSMRGIANLFGIHRSTLFRLLSRHAANAS